MSSSHRRYQYGSDPKNIVTLTPEEAWVVNTLRLYPVEIGSKTYYKSNLTDEQMIVYNEVTSYLNEYIMSVGGSIAWDSEKQPDPLIPV